MRVFQIFFFLKWISSGNGFLLFQLIHDRSSLELAISPSLLPALIYFDPWTTLHNLYQYCNSQEVFCHLNILNLAFILFLLINFDQSWFHKSFKHCLDFFIWGFLKILLHFFQMNNLFSDGVFGYLPLFFILQIFDQLCRLCDPCEVRKERNKRVRLLEFFSKMEVDLWGKEDWVYVHYFN